MFYISSLMMYFITCLFNVSGQAQSFHNDYSCIFSVHCENCQKMSHSINCNYIFSLSGKCFHCDSLVVWTVQMFSDNVCIHIFLYSHEPLRVLIAIMTLELQIFRFYLCHSTTMQTQNQCCQLLISNYSHFRRQIARGT